MDAKLLIDINRRELIDAQARGLASIQVETLHSIFNSMEEQLDAAPSQAGQIQLETFRSDLAASLAHQEHVNSWNLENFRQVIALGQSTLKSIMLINGGAAVALLAFLGNLINAKNNNVGIPPFANSMRLFVIGVFLAAVAYALTYFSQLFYAGAKPWHQRAGVAFHVITSLAGAAALVLFLCGAFASYRGFIGIAP